MTQSAAAVKNDSYYLMTGARTAKAAAMIARWRQEETPVLFLLFLVTRREKIPAAGGFKGQIHQDKAPKVRPHAKRRPNDTAFFDGPLLRQRQRAEKNRQTRAKTMIAPAITGPARRMAARMFPRRISRRGGNIPRAGLQAADKARIKPACAFRSGGGYHKSNGRRND